jgi:hypothetical protein
MLNDGDSKAFTAVEKMCPHGSSNLGEKSHCINHFAKRLSYHLNEKFKDNASVIMTTKSGKAMKRSVLGGQGKLTDAMICTINIFNIV